jgi:hypothetical protein
MNTAEAMRCGDKLVMEGDNQFDVLAKCGEPLDKQIYEQSTPLYNYAGYQIGVNTSTVEKWIYQKSPAEFQYELIFIEGVVKQINANRNP